ncbi:ribonucleoprotein PTB-binding 2 isoform X6 [Heterocephalus glaber]|uniref:Ribonucleoprotein PTB-binding 2 isoform X6 n=1 Tax=Heterocephalus glaber TaxID=10181 RepID=A0AAX6STX0_HETGA|nr:ribonucleoprotein PTB-binding 2 isoform X6 [Heterocephalus glaber]
MAAAGAGSESSPGSGGPGARALAAEEVRARLQRMRRALGNRRKILVRNLPRGCGCQEVHDLLKDYELKYCYVDRNKRTAFVTLLNGDQARSAIRVLHRSSFRGEDLIVQLQPTDALLCVTNLPLSFTLEDFEELVRAYGNIERCFLVYSEVTGLSKGYGFVEYMKKDSAARARLELLGKRLGPWVLFAQWMDVNLLASDRVHSKCLCVDKLPAHFSDTEELLQCLSRVHTPVFCQVQSSRKGLLPEPSPVQVMKGLSNPATLQALLCGRAAKPAVLGAPPSLPQLLSPPALRAFLHLSKAHQKPGLLGDPPGLVLQTALGMGPALPLKTELGPPVEAPGSKPLNLVPTPATMPATVGLLPFFPGQRSVGPASLGPRQEQHPVALGVAEGGFSGPQPHLQSFASLAAGGLLAAHCGQRHSQLPEPGSGAASKSQTSLLGEPPKEIRLSKNPYLNLASVLPGGCLPSAAGQSTLQKPGLPSTILDALAQGTAGSALEKCVALSPPFGGSTQVSSFRTEKRGAAYLLAAPEGGVGDCMDQHAQGMGMHYMETYLKKKRVY